MIELPKLVRTYQGNDYRDVLTKYMVGVLHVVVMNQLIKEMEGGGMLIELLDFSSSKMLEMYCHDKYITLVSNTIKAAGANDSYYQNVISSLDLDALARDVHAQTTIEIKRSWAAGLMIYKPSAFPAPSSIN